MLSLKEGQWPTTPSMKELSKALLSVTNPNERIGVAQAMKSVEALRDQLREESLIDFLSGEHWLPSYAFPQDVVKLLVRQPNWTGKMRLERDGEFGISRIRTRLGDYCRWARFQERRN